jgi:hypothetical protein
MPLRKTFDFDVASFFLENFKFSSAVALVCSILIPRMGSLVAEAKEAFATKDAMPLEPPDTAGEPEYVPNKKYGTVNDMKDMSRMGKVQQLRVSVIRLPTDCELALTTVQRGFKFFSIFGYSAILGCTWEFALV